MVLDSDAIDPDPQRRIARDDRFTNVHINMVPSQTRPDDVVAIHVGFNISDPAKWNHETSPLQMWINQPSGQVRLSTQLIMDHTEYRVAESQSPLSLSFELQIPKNQEGNIQLTAYALFNLCKSEGGQCLYRRRDFTIDVPVVAE